MTRAGDKLRSRFFGGEQLSDELVDAIQGYLERDEEIQYRLRSTGGIEHERDGETDEIPVAAGGTSLAVVTDRKLLFAVTTPNGETGIEIPYTDIRTVEADEGLLGATLTVEVWVDGTYRLTPNNREDLAPAADYLERISACWQRVIAALEEVHEQKDRLAAAREGGRETKAREARETAEGQLEKAVKRVEESGEGARDILRERIRSTEREFHRTRMDAHIRRAEVLLRQARHGTDSRAYTDAYESYERAREHLERTLVIAIDHGFDRASEIQELIDTVENRTDALVVQPIALAHQARERAEGTEKPDVAVQAWQDALDHYRDALTAGWGRAFDFSGQDGTLRPKIERTVADLIAARREFARILLDDGIKYRDAGDLETADKRFEMARNQLDAAEQLAREYRSGDRDAIHEQRDRVERHRSALAVVSI